jgi:hypothetical protein
LAYDLSVLTRDFRIGYADVAGVGPADNRCSMFGPCFTTSRADTLSISSMLLAGCTVQYSSSATSPPMELVSQFYVNVYNQINLGTLGFRW